MQGQSKAQQRLQLTSVVMMLEQRNLFGDCLGNYISGRIDRMEGVRSSGVMAMMMDDEGVDGEKVEEEVGCCCCRSGECYSRQGKEVTGIWSKKGGGGRQQLRYGWKGKERRAVVRERPSESSWSCADVWLGSTSSGSTVTLVASREHRGAVLCPSTHECCFTALLEK